MYATHKITNKKMKKTLLITSFAFYASNSQAAEQNYNSPLEILKGEQKTAYINAFNHTMSYTKPNEYYHWALKTSAGNIKVGKTYISKSKALCRDFSETFNIEGKEGVGGAAACKREDNSWCIIRKKTEPHTCAIENIESSTDKIMRDAKGLMNYF